MTRQPIRFLSAPDGMRLAYTVSGRGSDLVHMPFTFGADLQRTQPNEFDSWYEGLAERFRLIRYEGRGHGYGGRNLTSFTQEDILWDLQAVVKAQTSGPFYLLASFWYANAALRFALERPGALRGLILWIPYSSTATSSAGLAYIAKHDWGVFLRNVATMNHFVSDEQELQKEIDALGAALELSDFVQMRRGFEAMPDVNRFLSRVTTATLLIKPTDVVTTYETDVAAMAATMPRASVVVIDGSSVCPIADQTPPTLHAIDEFVQECEGGPQAGGIAGGHLQNGLSQREYEVLCRVAEGRSNAEIATDLVVSVRTVERHVQNIYTKVGAHNRAEATGWAIRRGLA